MVAFLGWVRLEHGWTLRSWASFTSLAQSWGRLARPRSEPTMRLTAAHVSLQRDEEISVEDHHRMLHLIMTVMKLHAIMMV